jgi:membrane fusion protein, multidrug efflux system
VNTWVKTWDKKWKWGIGALVVAGLAAGGVFAAKAMNGDKKGEKKDEPTMLQFTPNEVATVKRTPIPVTLQATGVVAAERSAIVRAKTSAVITQLNVSEGQAVKAGQVLAVLDSSELQQRVAAQDGAMAASQARMAVAKKARDQQQALFNQQYISQSALDTAQSGYDAAVGDARAAQAQVALAKQTLGDAVLRSPVNGVVAKRMVQLGEKVSFDTPLMQIVDLTTLELQCWVPPDALSQLQVGGKVQVVISGVSTPIAASIKRVLPVADAATRQIGVVIALPNSSQNIKAGLQATALIVLSTAQELAVPTAAIADNAGVSSVWQALPKAASKDEFTVKRVPVTMGLRDDTAGVSHILRTQIKEGEVVLAGRYDGLKDGQTVKFVNAAQTTVPATLPTSAPASTPASAAKPS